MRYAVSRGLWLVVFLLPAVVGLLRGEPDSRPADPTPALIQQLGSDVFASRLDASKKLVNLGEKAIPALRRAAANHDDLEVRRRASEILRAILPVRRASKAIGLELMLIESGSFDMGSPTTERNRRLDESLHGVRIKESFYLGTYEVTQDEYQSVMRVNPSTFCANGGGRDSVRDTDTSRFPVENVTWFDAIDFCNRLSKRDDLPPYYLLAEPRRDGGAIRDAKVTVLGGNGYRLPTEAEWEFSCRAQTDSPYHFGRAPTGREANFKSSLTGGYGGAPLWKALGRTAKVGNYAANGHGLHDMHGNVGEWCWDYYDRDYYNVSPRLDPRGPKTGLHRVCRGGSWMVTEASSRSASRLMLLPGEANYNTGFRVARNP